MEVVAQVSVLSRFVRSDRYSVKKIRESNNDDLTNALTKKSPVYYVEPEDESNILLIALEFGLQKMDKVELRH